MFLLRPTIVAASLSTLLAGTFVSEGSGAWAAPPESRVVLRVQTDEAEAVLSILAKESLGQAVSEDDWQRLFSTEPYLRLKQRESAMKRDFTDESFKSFVLSPELAAKADALRKTLSEWKKADLNSSAERVLTYLPGQAHIRAKVFPVIKPKPNSFVFDNETDPTIFLYIDTQETASRFENTVAHEIHHIGFASVASLSDQKLIDLPATAKPVVQWLGAFGEGFAMLAAAGSPEVHPHAMSLPEDRARWDRDMANFNRDVGSLQVFFLDILSGKLKTKEEVDGKGYSFFGVQGPWYTVGYKMAVTVEHRYGRAVLVDCMLDPRQLLVRYNAAAAELNGKHKDQLALWSPELLAKVGAVKETGSR
jgi:hypothetical protein